ncbi:MAG: hypothetical protein WAL63_01220 [Solirubrobacteraceae bacterium]
MATDTSGSSAGRASGISMDERRAFAALADGMIPASAGMPSASQSGAHLSGLDAVLAARPDLADPLREALTRVNATPPGRSALEVVRSPGHEDDWGVLGIVVAAAYFVNPEVRAALGYPGQEALPVDELPDDLDPELLASVRERGSVYRSTPPD